jgi:hypothetical protein
LLRGLPLPIVFPCVRGRYIYSAEHQPPPASSDLPLQRTIWARKSDCSRRSVHKPIKLLSPNSFYDEIPPNILEWIPKQKIFFVATAALRSKPGERAPDNRLNAAGRRVDQWGYPNVSPKEMGLFEVVDKNTVRCKYIDTGHWSSAYPLLDQDLTGSGKHQQSAFVNRPIR